MPRQLCETCRQEIDVNDPGTVHAVQLVEARGFGQTSDLIEGQGALFHAECFDENDPRYRRKGPPREA
jgi:hypothetical protein